MRAQAVVFFVSIIMVHGSVSASESMPQSPDATPAVYKAGLDDVETAPAPQPVTTSPADFFMESPLQISEEPIDFFAPVPKEESGLKLQPIVGVLVVDKMPPVQATAVLYVNGVKISSTPLDEEGKFSFAALNVTSYFSKEKNETIETFDDLNSFSIVITYKVEGDDTEHIYQFYSYDAAASAEAIYDKIKALFAALAPGEKPVPSEHYITLK